MRQAKKNLDATLALERRFPDNVFRGRWDAFYFFNAELLFERDSAERLKVLLASENGAVICVRNLDIANTERNPDDTFFFEKETLGETYWARLYGKDPVFPGYGWGYSMYNYGYTSELGGWCIYCEKMAEFGVVAVCEGGAPGQFTSAIKAFGALPIKQAIEHTRCYTLTPGILLEEWRMKLIQNYSSSQERPQEW
ncbi:MAG TPA: hypothetical protein VID19_05790 [Candidatus Eremiobacteraceae bacterium]